MPRRERREVTRATRITTRATTRERDIDDRPRAAGIRDFSILTGNSGGVRVLVGVLHVLHQRLAAEEELVAYWTAGCVRAADQGGVLLEHNTLLQLLFWGAGRRSSTGSRHTRRTGREPTQRIPPQSCEPEAQDRQGTEQNDLPVRVKAPIYTAATTDLFPFCSGNSCRVSGIGTLWYYRALAGFPVGQVQLCDRKESK